MSVPQVLFIDTSIFDAQNYDYVSSAFSSFIDEIKTSRLCLLLPDSTERKINRHISERVQQAVNVLKKAGRRVPFLAFPLGQRYLDAVF